MAGKNFFEVSKSNVSGRVDLSRQGEVDEALRPLLTTINAHPDLFSLSSCSGRIILYKSEEEKAEEGDVEKVKKRGCQWLYTTHDSADKDKVWAALLAEEEESSAGSAVFKFEPLILHVQCRSLDVARRLHALSLSCGLKNSGISVGKAGRKFVVALRSAHGLEAPITDDEGQRLVGRQYVDFLVAKANSRLLTNLKRLEILHEALKAF